MIECIKYKKHIRGSLLGFADLKYPSKGFVLQGCTLHQKDGKRWVNLPAKEFSDENGEKKFFSIFRFIDTSEFNEFKNQALKAIDKKVLEESSLNNNDSMFEEEQINF